MVMIGTAFNITAGQLDVLSFFRSSSSLAEQLPSHVWKVPIWESKVLDKCTWIYALDCVALGVVCPSICSSVHLFALATDRWPLSVSLKVFWGQDERSKSQVKVKGQRSRSNAWNTADDIRGMVCNNRTYTDNLVDLVDQRLLIPWVCTLSSRKVADNIRQKIMLGKSHEIILITLHFIPEWWQEPN